MSVFQNVERVLEQARTGNASENDLQTAYDHVSQNTSPQAVQTGLAEAFRSEQTPEFPQMVARLFGQSDPNQKAGLLNTLLPKLAPNERKEVVGSTTDGAGILAGQVTPIEAQNVQPPMVAALAERAQRKDPSVMDHVAGFYAQHPRLVKTLGAAALAVLVAKAVQHR